MTTISAKIIADSVSPEGIRLTTMHLRYPRFIHAEVMTHRVFSRNARSSRAVPAATMIQEVIDDPVIPIHWGKAQKGMQAYEENETPVCIHGNTITREAAWLHARDRAVEIAQAFADAGYHKQVVNRLLEPFMHIDTLVTATQWSNFLALRDHHAAEPHIQVLARAVGDAMAASEPEFLQPGQWHLPYLSDEEMTSIWLDEFGGGQAPGMEEEALDFCRKISVARCARISYTPFDGNGSYEAELKRYDLLVGEQPIHASPAEHQATPDTMMRAFWNARWHHPELHGNFEGWIQYRKTLAGECL